MSDNDYSINSKCICSIFYLEFFNRPFSLLSLDNLYLISEHLDCTTLHSMLTKNNYCSISLTVSDVIKHVTGVLEGVDVINKFGVSSLKRTLLSFTSILRISVLSLCLFVCFSFLCVSSAFFFYSKSWLVHIKIISVFHDYCLTSLCYKSQFSRSFANIHHSIS